MLWSLVTQEEHTILRVFLDHSFHWTVGGAVHVYRTCCFYFSVDDEHVDNSNPGLCWDSSA